MRSFLKESAVIPLVMTRLESTSLRRVVGYVLRVTSGTGVKVPDFHPSDDQSSPVKESILRVASNVLEKDE